MAMTYGNVYVAQIAMGADKNQTIKAILEAERYDGPSLLIAYAPCISHGIKEGMGKSMASMKQAVDAGYWHLYRYNPQLIKEGRIRLHWIPDRQRLPYGIFKKPVTLCGA